MTYEAERKASMTGPEIWPLVHADLDARERVGQQRYKVPLTADSDKDFLQEAYEECLDQAVYLRAEIERRRNGK